MPETALDRMFRTHEGNSQILVEKIIGWDTVGWHIEEIGGLHASSGEEMHLEAVKKFTDAPVVWTGHKTQTGYEFVVTK